MTYIISPKVSADTARRRAEKARARTMTPEQKKERARLRAAEKREAWRREIEGIRAMHSEKYVQESQKETEKAARKNAAWHSKLAAIHAALRSDEFRGWYEQTTGGDVQDFLDRVAISQAEWFYQVGDSKFFPGSVDQIEWTQRQIERVTASNYWRDPETRAMWAAKITEIDDCKERRSVLLALAKPRWADDQKIADIYARRRAMDAETGKPHDVDHIVPIVNRLVCGLHCEANLRIIPASENRQKSNKFDVELDFLDLS